MPAIVSTIMLFFVVLVVFVMLVATRAMVTVVTVFRVMGFVFRAVMMSMEMHGAA